MDIKKKIEINLELKVSCRKCEETMINTASITKTYLYFACTKCGTVITIDLDIKN